MHPHLVGACLPPLSAPSSHLIRQASPLCRLHRLHCSPLSLTRALPQSQGAVSLPARLPDSPTSAPHPREETACPSGTLLWHPCPHPPNLRLHHPNLRPKPVLRLDKVSSLLPAKPPISHYCFYSSSPHFAFRPPQNTSPSFNFLLFLTLAHFPLAEAHIK